jgi:hypothetical protein
MIELLLAATASIAACAEYEEIVARLDGSGYAIAAQGIAEDGALLFEIFVDNDGDWVALLTRASDRFSCIKAIGSDWAAPQSGYPV